jgi:hypothetical protein
MMAMKRVRNLPFLLLFVPVLSVAAETPVVEEILAWDEEIDEDVEEGLCVLSTVELNANDYQRPAVGAIRDSCAFSWYEDFHTGDTRLARARVRQDRNGYREFTVDYLFDGDGALLRFSYLHRTADAEEPVEEAAFYFSDGRIVHVDRPAWREPFTDEELAEQAALIAVDAERIREYFFNLLELPDPLETAWASRVD